VRDTNGATVPDAKVTVGVKNRGGVVTRTDLLGTYKVPGFGKEVDPKGRRSLLRQARLQAGPRRQTLVVEHRSEDPDRDRMHAPSHLGLKAISLSMSGCSILSLLASASFTQKSASLGVGMFRLRCVSCPMPNLPAGLGLW
jgi:hypothetical protein